MTHACSQTLRRQNHHVPLKSINREKGQRPNWTTHFYSYDSKVLLRYRLFRSKLGMHVRHTSFIRQKVKFFVQNKELGLCPLVLFLDAYMYPIMCKKIKFEAWRVKIQRYLLNKRVRLGHWLSADKSKDTCNISFVIDRPKKKPFKVFELVNP